MMMEDADAIHRMFDFDFTIQLMDLKNIPESVCPNSDGSYTIFVNQRLSAEKQRMSVLHALFHILEDDFDKDDVDEIEYTAHNNMLQ